MCSPYLVCRRSDDEERGQRGECTTSLSFRFPRTITTALRTFRLLRPEHVFWEHTAVLLRSLLEGSFQVRLMTLEGIEWLVSTSCEAFCCVMKEERNGMRALGGRGPGTGLRARKGWSCECRVTDGTHGGPGRTNPAFQSSHQTTTSSGERTLADGNIGEMYWSWGKGSRC